MNQRLKKDALSNAGSIHSLNAPYCLGYLFNENKAGNEIAEGMYCDRFEEIDPERWDYFLSRRGEFFDIRKPHTMSRLQNQSIKIIRHAMGFPELSPAEENALKERINSYAQPSKAQA